MVEVRQTSSLKDSQSYRVQLRSKHSSCILDPNALEANRQHCRDSKMKENIY
jgi:hypothetical protein